MDKVYDVCCGIDVHKKLIVACLKKGNKTGTIREFGATTRSLLELTEWLKENSCEMVAMESTGSYWKPLFNILEIEDIKAIVVNAQHMKAVPGRKTDVKDAAWIADLLQHGLLQASYIPSREQRELREAVILRKSYIEERSREENRIQKVLEGGNIKLSGTISNINGMSGHALLLAIINGEKVDAAKIRQMQAEKRVSVQLKASPEQIAEDLNGVLSDLQRIMLTEMLHHIDELNGHIRKLDDYIWNNMNDDSKEAVEAIKTIPGIGDVSAQAIISVIGTDMSRFPTDKHISKWAGLCPGNNVSANKRKSGRTTKGNQTLRTTLIVCAHAAASCKKSYFSAQFSRISPHRGSKRAYVAVAHSMLIAIYHMLKDKLPFADLGADYYNQYNRERKANGLLKRLKSLGYSVNIASAT